MLMFSKIRNELKETFDTHPYAEGENYETVTHNVERIMASDDPIVTRRSEAINYMLCNARIKINPLSVFADGIEENWMIAKLRRIAETEQFKRNFPDLFEYHSDVVDCCAFAADADYSHLCPDWGKLLSVGIPGIISEADSYLSASDGDADKESFYRSVKTVYSGILSLFDRYLGIIGESENEIKLKSVLESLKVGAPNNLHEAMQLQLTVFTCIQEFDHNYIRTLGRLDELFLPFYENDLRNGATEEEERELIRYYLFEYHLKKVGSNTPFMLCPFLENGNDASNKLTDIILTEYASLGVHDPKIQILYRPDLPDRVLKVAAKSITKGNNSFVFVNDRVAREALINNGADEKDALDYSLVGCYEPLCSHKHIAGTCNGKINVPKAIEAALLCGKCMLTEKVIGLMCKSPDEYKTFEEFYDEVKHQLRHFIDMTIAVTNAKELAYKTINSTPFMSPLTDDCMAKGLDSYHGGVRYFDSSVDVFGIGTAADALCVIKKLVFSDKEISLGELAKILKNDWKDCEALRLKCLKNYPKYGNGDKEADGIANDLFEFSAGLINGRQNSKGGVYRLGTFSIDWAYSFGQKTGASADGRHAKEPVSKNMCPSIAADKNGVTAVIRSALTFDYTKVPNGTVLDIMLHSSAVSGDDGINVLVSLIKAFMSGGGFAIQFNIFDSEALKDAKKNPQKYPNLQVRLCGWNVYFNNLTEYEQDAIIRQSEALR